MDILLRIDYLIETKGERKLLLFLLFFDFEKTRIFFYVFIACMLI